MMQSHKKLLKQLAANPKWSGDIDLRGCTGLTALPDGFTVGGWVDLSGCTGLTALLARARAEKQTNHTGA